MSDTTDKLIAGWVMVAALLAMAFFAGIVIDPMGAGMALFAALIGWLLLGLIGIAIAFNIATWRGKL